MVVEFTARPGLSIQITNRDGVKWRLEKAAGLKVNSTAKGVRLAKELFGGEIEEGIESISGKQVIGLIERVKLIGVNGKERTVLAKIDTGADSTSIDTKLAKFLGYTKELEVFEQDAKRNDQTKDERNNLEEELRERYTAMFPETFADVQFIRSSHGLSLRPYLKVKMEISETELETTVNIYDRETLKYPMIIGRKSLGNFLIDPGSKYTTIRKP